MNVTLGAIDEVVEAAERQPKPSVDIAQCQQHGVDRPWRVAVGNAGASLGKQMELVLVRQSSVGDIAHAPREGVDRAQRPPAVGRLRLYRAVEAVRLRAGDLLTGVVGGVNVDGRQLRRPGR